MRAFNRILSLLLGMALIAGGLLVVVEVVTAFVRDTPWPIRVDQWAATLRQQTFADTIEQLCGDGIQIVAQQPKLGLGHALLGGPGAELVEVRQGTGGKRRCGGAFHHAFFQLDKA